MYQNKYTTVEFRKHKQNKIDDSLNEKEGKVEKRKDRISHR